MSLASLAPRRRAGLGNRIEVGVMEAAGPHTVALGRGADGLEKIEAKSLAVPSGLAAADELRGDSIHLSFIGCAGGGHCRRLPGPGR